ncbi:acyl-CoA dehydrogenase family protein [Blastomonas sp. SL216]|uniref:acyl-CoA dehydrogenase family protein n=1 Tax=Blastomonas sp. SL216 TaxID=2995169 RepID=UPI0023778CD7|nr:acyl-CoA dehydrogenase family protein [Blastomonas sp. SL216]
MRRSVAVRQGFFRRSRNLGFMGMTAPAHLGGAGAEYVSYTFALMEVVAADGALLTINWIQNSLILSGILKDGNPAQQERLLPRLIAGTTIGPLR